MISLKKLKNYAMPLLILGGLSSCALQVKTVQGPDTDFSNYESWCWMQGCEVVYQGPDYYYDQRVIDEISNAIAWNMYDKGYVQGDEESDLVLNFYIILEKDSTEIREREPSMDGTGYNGIPADRTWLLNEYPEYQQFLKGTLVIDVIDRRESKLVFTSKAIRYMDINPEYDKKLIWNSVGKAMKKVPGRGGD